MTRSVLHSTIFALALVCTTGAAFSQGGPCPGLVAVSEGLLQPLTPDASFGGSVSRSGDWVLAGVHGSDIGEATFFERTGTGWVSRNSWAFGRAGQVDGDLAMLGLSDSWIAAQAFQRSGTTWNASQTVPSQWTDNHDDFGYAVALDGDAAAISALDWLGGVGLVEVFDHVGGAWVWRTGVWSSSNPGIGGSIDLDGDWLVSSGKKATVFDLASPGAAPQLLNPGGVSNQFDSVAVSGDTLAIGSPQGTPGGRVYLFDFDGTSWIRGPELKASDASANDLFGRSVSLDGDRLLVGAPGVDIQPGPDDGAAYVFERVGTTWIELGRFSEPGTASKFLGRAVSLDGDRAAVGASGTAYAYGLTRALPPTPYCTPGTTASGCKALASSAGTPSASAASGFVVAFTGSEGQKDGTLYFGTGGDQANPWGNGTSYQCVVPPVQRTGVLQGAGSLGNCDGSFQLDFNAWMAANPQKAPGSGDDVYMQCWFRDPQNTSNQTTSLSEALGFTVCP